MSNTVKTIDDLLPIYNCGYCANDETCEDCLGKRDSLKQAILTLIEQEKKELLERVQSLDDGTVNGCRAMSTYVDEQVAALNNITIEGEKHDTL